MVIRTAAIALLSLALVACAVTPGQVRPTLDPPDRFVQAAAAEQAHVANEIAFWQRFDDHRLTVLIEDALGANHDLRIGLARWQQARALARQSTLDLAPTITAQAGAQSRRASAGELPGADRRDRDQDVFDAGIGATWELDFFGRVRQQVQAARAEAQASAADLATLQVAVVAELATSYFQLRGLQERLRVARGNADNQAESLELVDIRLAAGVGTEFDTARARAQLAATRSRLPALDAAIANRMHRIAVLTGRTPDELIDVLAIDAPSPRIDLVIDPGTPGDLLRRRPDIAAAEYRLQAAAARVGVATADLFPRFTLAGLIGSRAADVGALFERDSETRLLALGIDWSFLDTGRVRARIAAAEAAAAEHLARYEQTVLLALEDTETALAGYRHARAERDFLREAAQASAEASELARIQFDGGLVEFLAVLDAERIQLEAEDRLAQAEAEAAIGLVAIYQALAGGWPEHLPGPIAMSNHQRL